MVIPSVVTDECNHRRRWPGISSGSTQSHFPTSKGMKGWYLMVSAGKNFTGKTLASRLVAQWFTHYAKAVKFSECQSKNFLVFCLFCQKIALFEKYGFFKNNEVNFCCHIFLAKVCTENFWEKNCQELVVHGRNIDPNIYGHFF